MALLNPSPALPLPSAMWVTYRAVSQAGRPLTRDDLLSLTSPACIRSADGGERKPTESAKVALDTLITLEVITSADGGLAVPTGPLATYAQFCDVLRTAILRQRPEKAPLDESRSNDLLRAVSWLLMTDPMGTPWVEDTVAQQRVPEQQEKVFVNPVRWRGFRFWAVALGFAEEWDPREEGGAPHIIADPTRALRHFVARSYSAGETIAAPRMMRDFRDAVPVVPGGEISRSLGYSLEPDEVDRATAYALENAQARGWLQMERLADAAEAVLLPELSQPGTVRSISHVIIQEGKA